MNATQFFITGTDFTQSGCTDINATANFCQNYFAPYLHDIKMFGYLVALAALVLIFMTIRNQVNKKILRENKQIRDEIVAKGGTPREPTPIESALNMNFKPLMKEGIEDGLDNNRKQ